MGAESCTLQGHFFRELTVDNATGETGHNKEPMLGVCDTPGEDGPHP